MDQLTPRQRAAIRLSSRGYNQQEIARELGLAYSTVRKLMMAARKRTGCRTTTEIAVRAAVEERQ